MRIVVTRPKGQGEELAERLRDLGHHVEFCPLIQIEPTGPAVFDADGYGWVVVTSPNGAHELATRMRGRPTSIAAVGPGTAAALRAHGLEPDLVPAVSTQEGLLAELPRPAGRVLFAAAVGARTLLVEQLDADFVPLYRIQELRPQSFPEADLVALASPSAARAYAALGRTMPVVAIGPETSRAAEEAGLPVAAVASAHDLDGLVDAVRRVGG
jgi:uroporphyrinogen III methyltransferase / synthase